MVQFPGQAGVTKGFRRGGKGGAPAEALRFCAGFVDACWTYNDCAVVWTAEEGAGADDGPEGFRAIGP